MISTKILLADDDVVVVDILAKRLIQENYEVIKAYDGEEAWRKIQSESPDVIILDLTMPKKDGFAVLKDVRSQSPTTKWQPVIIVSGRSELDDMKTGYSLEADHYLIKPCGVDEILKAIRLMLVLIPQRKNISEQNHDKA